jgi:excisionase family DNA binding protein
MVERAVLFVRLPATLASAIDARTEAAGRTKQAVVEDLLSTAMAEPPRPQDADDVVGLPGIAALLDVTEDDVLERIAEGDFPGRRIGGSWRFSVAAVRAWLAGTDPVQPRVTGFAGNPR